MIEDVRSQIDQYLQWLREQTSFRQIGDFVEITTPYLDRHNDCLQIFAKREGNGYVLTDDGHIVEDLEMSGCSIDSPRRQILFKTTLRGFGVQANGKALETRASENDFALRKHNLVQAMLAINDLFYLASPTVASLFNEDVTVWLDSARVRYTPSVKFTGKSGYDHRFDFVIPKSEAKPERVLRVINRPNRDTAQSMIFSWTDIKETRAPDTHAYAILNDSEQAISESTLGAFRNYDVSPVLWSSRRKAQEKLTA